MHNVRAGGDKRRPGRPPTYVFDRPEDELTENERRLRASVMKRRQRQNRSYHRRKRAKELLAESKKLAAVSDLHQVPPKYPRTPVNIVEEHSVVPSLDLRYAQSLGRLFDAHTVNSTAQSPNFSSSSKLSEISQQETRSCAGPIDAMLGNVAENASFVSDAAAYSDPFSSTAANQTAAPQVCSDSSQHLSLSPVQTSIVGRDANVVPVSALVADSDIQSDATSPAIDDEHLLMEEILDLTAKNSIELSGQMLRQAGVRAHVALSTEDRLNSLTLQSREGLRDLVSFPSSFDGEAAAAIMGLGPDKSSAADVMAILRPLVDLKFITISPSGRYSVNKVAAALLREQQGTGPTSGAKQRYVAHYLKVLRRLDNDGVNRHGKERAHAMRTFDLERDNMNCVHRLCREMGVKKLRAYLSAGATVIRYCVGAQERVCYFEEVVDVEGCGSEHAKPQSCAEVRECTRLSLALSEAYYDMLSIAKAESHLSKTLFLMGETVQGKCLPDIACSVLVLLLLAQLRIEKNQPLDAKAFLVRSLRAIHTSGLQNTTLAVNAMISLAVVYLMTREHEKAILTGNKLLDLVVNLGFKHMPIFADALGTVGLIHLHIGNAAEAERQFFAGLEVVESWISKSWEDTVPFHHCQDLDIWLLEGLAKAYIMQQKTVSANDLLSKASAARNQRGLGSVGTSWGENYLSSLPTHIIYPRHVY